MKGEPADVLDENGRFVAVVIQRPDMRRAASSGTSRGASAVACSDGGRAQELISLRGFDVLDLDDADLAALVARWPLTTHAMAGRPCPRPAASGGCAVVQGVHVAPFVTMLEQVHRAYEEAQEGIRQRDEVLSIVLHDLGSSIGVVALSAKVIVRLATDERIRAAAETIQRAAQRMRRLVDDLRTLERAQGGNLTLEVRETSSAAIVAELVDAFDPIAEEKGLTLRREVPSGSATILGDDDRILEALSNYLTNALAVTPEGGVITVRAERVDGEVRISVGDTGPGIADPDVRRVFERSYRAPGVTYEGMGLGLAIAKAIAEAHGGRVWVESSVGAGSTFFLALPAVAASSGSSARRIGPACQDSQPECEP